MNAMPCCICGHAYHTGHMCFKEGGGLSCMNEEQRKAHIEHQRQLRGFYKGKGHADSAVEVKDPR